LNATLVVPELDHHSFWKDDRWPKNLIFTYMPLSMVDCDWQRLVLILCVICSDFSDIFDTDWFISYLSNDVTVVKRIPYEVMTSMDKLPWTMRAPRKSMPEFYVDEVLPILMRRRVSKHWFGTCCILLPIYHILRAIYGFFHCKHAITYKQKIYHFSVSLLIISFNFKITILHIWLSISSYMVIVCTFGCPIAYLSHGKLGSITWLLSEYILISLLLRGVWQPLLIGNIYQNIIEIC
jgi:hypothetical protein